jgi:hypothetical protein
MKCQSGQSRARDLGLGLGNIYQGGAGRLETELDELADRVSEVR